MTLDDFFTLTELDNGLTVPSRVRELMAVMQKERDCIAKNSTDSMRQRSTVTTAIAATENKDCLDLFVQLDGLHFISKWLKDAQEFSDDTTDSVVEESITHLLRALEKLHVNYEKLVASEIWTTVQNLLVHNSSKVQDKARVLFESWKSKRDNDASLSDVVKARALTDDEARDSVDMGTGIGHSESSLGDASISKEASVKDKGHELARDDPVVSTSSDAVQPHQAESAHDSNKIVDPPIGDERPQDHVSSPSLPKPSVEPPLCHSVGTNFEPCSQASSRQDTLDTRTELHDLDSPSYMKQSQKIESLLEKLGSLEESKMSEGRPFSSSSDAVAEMKAVTELSSHQNSNVGGKNPRDEDSSYVGLRTIDSDGKSPKDDSSDANQHRSSSGFVGKEVGDINHRMLQKSSSRGKSWGKPKDLGTFLSGIEHDGKVNAFGLHVNDNNLANNFTFGKKQMDKKPDRAGKKSDVEIDPLEVAMQVAMEVEREVVDYGEQSCSSSEKLPEGNTRQHNSLNSMSRKQSHGSEGSPMELANDPNLSDESSLMQEESSTSSENLDAEQTNGTQDNATSQLTEAAQEEANTEKGLCDFDLNQEVCSEDYDHPENQFPTTVSIVSASRAAAAPGLPGAPLQFEGNLGWKGSAVTSAFRPASPRRMPESDKDFSTGGSSSSSKQRQGCLDFDLNVAEDKHSSLPSGESSVETNSRRSEHLELDLNRTSENDGALLDWRIGQFFPQGNCHRNWSQSSSSSNQQPVRNIDLNDQPSLLNVSLDNSYLSKASQNFNVSGSINVKSDDSVISIMGTKVEVNRKDFVSQTPSLPNGQTPELAFDINSGRTGSFLGIGSALPYAHSSVYGYNNIAPGPAMPFSPRSLPTGFSQQPFVINMNGSVHSNGVGPSRSSFDLNSGMLVESGSKDPAGLGFGLFLNSAQVRPTDEQLRSNSQASMSSAVGGKRKEPENGYDQYPFKHYTPPWK
ncbi:hypothetical protein DH2020_034950 [Rehmannia glutinosa]|uniref:TFIIS N-terminal domain-containing protein n=1 Tax=Rehmannia glutinosa TaxID=99300 RepID=A0ABR0V7X8_REHGL